MAATSSKAGAATALAPSPLPPQPNLAATVAQHLLQEIREKGLPAGSRLPTERELMEALGVGRSTVREAINGLVMMGALEIRRGRGAFVLDPAAGLAHPSAIAAALARGVTADLFEARRLVEPEGARLAAERRTDADLTDIAKALEDHEEAIRSGRPAVEPAVRFHIAVVEAAHNEVIAGFVKSFQEPLAERGPVLEEVSGFRDWEIEQHRSVFEPIEAGDPQLAAERMRSHLDAVLPFHERLGLN